MSDDTYTILQIFILRRRISVRVDGVDEGVIKLA